MAIVAKQDYRVLQGGVSMDNTDPQSKWREVLLGDVCAKIGSGATPRGGKDVYLQDGPYSLIRSQNVYNDGFHRDGLAFIGEHHADELRNVEVFENDVLLNITGDSVARVCQVVPDVLPARVNQHVAIIRPDSVNLDAGYLRYCLVSPEMQTLLLSWAGSGGTRNALTKGMIESLEISIPPLREQREIAHVLGTLDDKIELNRRKNESLEEMARALFKSWFVDFDPVHAKAALRQHAASGSHTHPDQRGVDGEKSAGWTIERARAYLDKMDPSIAALFPDRFVDSDLGEIPEGWEVKRLADCFNLTMGQSPPGHTYNEIGEGLPFFQGNAEFGFRYPDRRRYCTEPSRIAHPYDTIVSVRAPVGAMNMAWEECCIGRGVAAMRHVSGLTSFTYYSAWGLQTEIQQYEHTGTVFGAINKKQFENLKIIQPVGKLIEAFDLQAQPLDKLIRSNESNSRNLTVQRHSLLPKLISGKIAIGS